MADAQAQDRAHRIGQKNEVHVFRLITTTPVEERILARANDKKNLTGLVVEAGKFNTRHEETPEDNNKEMMESLLKEWITNGAQPTSSSELTDESDVLDEDQINEMMATYDGELELYRSMDRTRNDTGGLLPLSETPYWLSNESCIPKCSWLFFPQCSDETSQVMEVVDGDFQHGKQLRKRKEVCYDDGLTDVQFMKKMDKEQEKVEVTPATKKRTSSDSMAMQMASCVDKLSRESFSGLFREKPSKQRYRDYYEVIKSPISLKEISRKLKSGGYVFFEEVESDFALMSHNARIYNGDQSQVFLLAEQVRKEFYELVKARLNHSPIFSSIDMPTLPVDSFNVRDENKHKIDGEDDLHSHKRMKI